MGSGNEKVNDTGDRTQNGGVFCSSCFCFSCFCSSQGQGQGQGQGQK